MRLTPEEIEAKEFVVALRGYDQDDVRAFLRTVAAEYRELAIELETVRRSEGDAGEQIDALTRHLNAVLRKATAEAAAIVANAERQAAQIRATQTPGLDESTDVLKRARNSVRQAVDRYMR